MFFCLACTRCKGLRARFWTSGLCFIVIAPLTGLDERFLQLGEFLLRLRRLQPNCLPFLSRLRGSNELCLGSLHLVGLLEHDRRIAVRP